MAINVSAELHIDGKKLAQAISKSLRELNMSWNASGQVEGAVDDTDFTWTPAYDSLDEGPREQAEFLLSMIEEAFSSGVIDGRYSVSMGGHVPDPENENSGSRRTLAISLNPVEAAATEDDGA